MYFLIGRVNIQCEADFDTVSTTESNCLCTFYLFTLYFTLFTNSHIHCSTTIWFSEVCLNWHKICGTIPSHPIDRTVLSVSLHSKHVQGSSFLEILRFCTWSQPLLLENASMLNLCFHPGLPITSLCDPELCLMTQKYIWRLCLPKQVGT